MVSLASEGEFFVVRLVCVSSKILPFVVRRTRWWTTPLGVVRLEFLDLW